jgi:hypothetical protein
LRRRYRTRRPYYNKFISTYNGAPAICCSKGMTSAAPSANARYNALQTKLDKRFSQGLQFNINYTWSKALGYANDNVFARYPSASFGPNDTNREHVFVISGVYQLPFGKNRCSCSQWSTYGLPCRWYSISGASTGRRCAPHPTYAEWPGCGLDNNSQWAAAASPPRQGSGAFALHAGAFNPIPARPVFHALNHASRN